MNMSKISRRDFVKLLGAGSALSAFGLAGCESAPKFSSSAPAKAAPRVVVIGGGFGGATCAKYLRTWGPNIDVTLIEPNDKFISCPMSNTVIAGLNKLPSPSPQLLHMRRTANPQHH